jgi:predicted nucleotidyltransferase
LTQGSICGLIISPWSSVQIRAFSNAIAREFHPRKIVLFGSYAYGKPTEDSDVDVLVIMPFNRKRGRKSLEIRQRIPADFPLDLIVRTPEFIARRLQCGDCFIQEILAKGDVLYEATDAGNGGEILQGAAVRGRGGLSQDARSGGFAEVVAAAGTSMAVFLPQAHLLADCAVDFRYPGDTATLAEARLALKNCRSIRREVRSSLGLPV